MRAFIALSPRKNASIPARNRAGRRRSCLTLKIEMSRPDRAKMWTYLQETRPLLHAENHQLVAPPGAPRTSCRWSCCGSVGGMLMCVGGGQCRSHCGLCGSTLSSSAVCAADAAQFCEEVRGSDFLNTLKPLLQCSESGGIHFVLLRDSKRRRADLSSNLHVCWLNQIR